MRFTLLAGSALAVAANAAAVTSAATTSDAPTTTQGPATISNTSAAISSVITQMSSNSPKADPSSTVYVTGDAPTSGGPKATGKSSATKKITTTTKKASKKTAAPTTTKKGAKKPKTTTKATSTPAKKKVSKRADATIVDRNQPCSPQATNQALAYNPSTNYTTEAALLTAYLGDSTFAAASKAGTPPGTKWTWLWQGFYASPQANWYQTYTLHSTYNVTACANICDNINDCESFAIFYERSPALAPATACPNPTAYTQVKCTYYNEKLVVKQATNTGEWRSRFPVVIAGSNAYTKVKGT
ncbi:hypothetical protein CAC42_3587 [Sphaceloma murrayae]|uniref:Uncharacterized protein n=1 Tax=Sphaceloma murrayae TaxID=2082308 RepID=A0A2K1QSW4_9PEZI|nr:hypothetical protein CAC42_3587 [Sphaceloma murrayae]